MPAVLEYRPAERTGRNVGVDGRDDGVSIELAVLVVAIVLTLLRPSSVDIESRDCGRRAFGAMVLLFNGLLVTVGKLEAEVDTVGRNADGAVIETRRFSFSLSFIGEGESSTINTHPDESLAGVLRVSNSLPKLCGRDLMLPRSSRGIDLMDEELDAAGEDVRADDDDTRGGGTTLVFGREVILPIRMRGTRVWIFCSSTFTRARISDTICTPLLFVAVIGTPTGIL